MKAAKDTVKLFRLNHRPGKIVLLSLLALDVILICDVSWLVILLFTSWSLYEFFGRVVPMVVMVLILNVYCYSIFGAHLTLSREGITLWEQSQTFFLPWKSITMIQGAEDKLLIILEEPATFTNSLREGKLQLKAVIKRSLLNRLLYRLAKLSESNIQRQWLYVNARGYLRQRQARASWQEYMQKYGSHIRMIDMSELGESVVPKADVE